MSTATTKSAEAAVQVRLLSLERQVQDLGVLLAKHKPAPAGVSLDQVEQRLTAWSEAFGAELIEMLLKREREVRGEVAQVKTSVAKLPVSVTHEEVGVMVDEVRRRVDGTLAQVSSESESVRSAASAGLAASIAYLRQASDRFAHGRGGLVVPGRGGALERALADHHQE